MNAPNDHAAGTLDESVVGARQNGHKSRRTLYLIAAICLAPIIASYATYYWFMPSGRVNYGELIAKPAPPVTGIALDGRPFRLADLHGKWVLLTVDDGACNARCVRKLYATRQARTIQGREEDRVVRVWLLSDQGTPTTVVIADHPGLVIAHADAAALGALFGGSPNEAILLLDPLGNVVLRYPADPDIKRMSKDLDRLLRASRIG